VGKADAIKGVNVGHQTKSERNTNRGAVNQGEQEKPLGTCATREASKKLGFEKKKKDGPNITKKRLGRRKTNQPSKGQEGKLPEPKIGNGKKIKAQ